MLPTPIVTRSTQRRLCFLVLSPLLALLLAGCTRSRMVPVTRVTDEATPGPVATAPVPLQELRVTFQGTREPRHSVLHGAPPYTAQLTAALYPIEATPITNCEIVQWTFGDGTTAVQPCQSGIVTATHTYQQSGTYHAQIQIELDDGTTITGDKTQTIIVANPQPPTLSATILRWLAWVGLLTALGLVLIALRFQQRRRRRLGYGLLLLFLISFVPPFSYAPDPLGVIQAISGRYRYNPNLPFVNRFLLAGDPLQRLSPFLDGLIGQTGLDPLDPQAPLERYEFISVKRGRQQTEVEVRFHYADGRQRTYPITLIQPDHLFGFYQRNWWYDGLARLRTEHHELAPVSFSGPAADIALAPPQRLPLPDVVYGVREAVVTATPFQTQPLLWSPHGDAFLTLANNEQSGFAALWLLPVNGGLARRLADNVTGYAWLPDGQHILYSTFFWQHDPDAPLRQIGSRLHLVSRHGGQPRELALPLFQSSFPGITAEGLWYAEDNSLWHLPLPDGRPQRLTRLAGLPSNDNGVRQRVSVQPAPDGRRIAYTCGHALCLIDSDGHHAGRVITDKRFVSLAWNAGGERLAAVFWDYDRPATLILFNRDGSLIDEFPLAPNGPVAAPQWLPDGERLLVQTFPHDGRRILSVDARSGEVLDLSQPRWDAYFALAPDGRRMLLSNGRGGFWLSKLEW